MSYECELVERPLQPTLYIRTRTTVQELPQRLGQAYGAIAQYLAELGETPAGPPYAGYYNMDMQDLDVEMGMPVSRALAGKGEIKAGQLPMGQAATTVHVGPYDAIEPAYNALMGWMAEQGHQGAGVAYELYLNDPAQTPPDQLRTQIIFPLK